MHGIVGFAEALPQDADAVQDHVVLFSGGTPIGSRVVQHELFLGDSVSTTRMPSAYRHRGAGFAQRGHRVPADEPPAAEDEHAPISLQ